MSMGDSDIDLFISQTNGLNSSFYIEPPLSYFHDETVTNRVAISSPKPRGYIETLPFQYSQMPPFMPFPPQAYSTTNQVNDTSFGLEVPFETMEQTPHAFINQRVPMSPKEPTPSSYFQNFLIDPKEQLPSVNLPRKYLPINPQNQRPQEYFASQNILLHGEDQPTHFSPHYPRMNTHEKHQFSGERLPPPDVNFQTQSSQVPYRPFSMSLNFVNAMADLLGHDPEAVLSFLAGEVRPGPNVTEIYKCRECFVQFPNAQAFGGHMSSHSKNKQTVKGNSRKDKYSIEASSSNTSRMKAKRKANVSREEESKKKKKTTSGNETIGEGGCPNDHDRDLLGETRCECVEMANSELVLQGETSFNPQ